MYQRCTKHFDSVLGLHPSSNYNFLWNVLSDLVAQKCEACFKLAYLLKYWLWGLLLEIWFFRPRMSTSNFFFIAYQEKWIFFIYLIFSPYIWSHKFSWKNLILIVLFNEISKIYKKCWWIRFDISSRKKLKLFFPRYMSTQKVVKKDWNFWKFYLFFHVLQLKLNVKNEKLKKLILVRENENL